MGSKKREWKGNLKLSLNNMNKIEKEKKKKWEKLPAYFKARKNFDRGPEDNQQVSGLMLAVHDADVPQEQIGTHLYEVYNTKRWIYAIFYGHVDIMAIFDGHFSGLYFPR